MNFTEGLKIHEKLFPKATVHSQIVQLNEELEELKNAVSTADLYEEIGDVLFVAVSLMRFDNTKNIADFILDLMYYKQNVKEQKRRLKYFEKSIEKSKKKISDERYYFQNRIYKRDKNFYKEEKCAHRLSLKE